MSFALDLSKFADKANKRTEQVVRKVVLDCAKSVVTMSPVDKGTFKGNWDYGVGSAPSQTFEAADSSGAVSIARIQSKSSGVQMVGKTHFIANNIPYAQRLENGYSRQAPNGMVHLTAMRFQPIVDAAARALR